MRASTDTALHFTGKMGESVIGFLTVLYIAHAHGPSALGLYALAVAVATWASIPIAAIANAIAKRTSEDGHGGYLTAGVLLSGVLLVGILQVLWLAAGPIQAYTGVDIEFLAGLVIAMGVFSLAGNAFVGRTLVAQDGLINAIDRVIRLVAIVGLVTLGWGVTGIVVGHIAGVILAWSGGVLAYWSRLDPARPRMSDGGDLLRYAKHIWLDVVRARAFSWTDTLVLGVFVSPALVGVYEVAWRLGQVILLVSQSIQRAVFPRISTSTSGDYSRVRGLLEDSLAYPGIIAFPAIIGAGILGANVFRVYGSDFLVPGAGFVLVGLLVAAGLGTFGRQFIGALNAIDRHDTAFRINAVTIGANLVLNVVLVIHLGWIGAAIATPSTFALSLVLGYVAIRRELGGVGLPMRDISDQLLAALLMGGAVGALVWIFPIQSIPWLLAVVGVGAGLYGLWIVALSDTVRSTASHILRDIWALGPARGADSQ